MCSADQSEVKCFIVELLFSVHLICSLQNKNETKLEMQLADWEAYMLRLYFFKDDGI